MKFRKEMINLKDKVAEIQCFHNKKWVPFSEYENLKKEYPELVGHMFRYYTSEELNAMQTRIDALTPVKDQQKTKKKD